MFGGGGNAAHEAQVAREEQKKREADIASGSRDIRASFAKQFDTDYYTALKKSMSDYYLNSKKFGVNAQFEGARKQLASALIGRGLDESSVGVGMNQRLEDQKAQKVSDVTQMTLGAESQKKQDLLQAQNSVIAQLQNTGDTSLAMAQAAQAQSANAQRPAFSPLGSIFQDVTAGLATQADMERQGINRYNIFNRGAGGGPRYMRTVG